MPTHLKGKLVFYDVPASDLENSGKFYAALLGSELARTPNPKQKGLFHPLSADGIDITIHSRRKQDPPDIPTAYFAVADLDAAIRELEAAGGKRAYEPTDIPLPTGEGLKRYRAQAKRSGHDVGKRIGRGAVMRDPDDNPVGLVQLEGHAAYYFRAGQFQPSIRADQAEGVEQALAHAK